MKELPRALIIKKRNEKKAGPPADTSQDTLHLANNCVITEFSLRHFVFGHLMDFLQMTEVGLNWI